MPPKSPHLFAACTAWHFPWRAPARAFKSVRLIARSALQQPEVAWHSAAAARHPAAAARHPAAAVLQEDKSTKSFLHQPAIIAPS
jgi:hypothetical protein